MKRMPTKLALPVIFLAITIANAQTLSPGVSAQVDKVFEKWNRTDSPGCALGVYKDGQIVYQHGQGMANLNDDVTITPETVFHVASMSKQFTAASILLLAQQGKLSLDDDVHKYIPELAEYPGAFLSEEIDAIYRIAHQDGKLTLNRMKHKPDTLSPDTTDVFSGDIGTIHFTRDANKRISGFILDAGRIQNFRFTKMAK